MTATGGCACGAVRYRAQGPLRPVIACHCETCRRSSGHHVAATACACEQLEIEGEVAWWSASPGHRRGFCPVCGSSLFWEREGGPAVSIMAGTLDPPTGLALVGHIFVAEKGDYYAIADGLPQTDARSDTLQLFPPAS